MPSGGTALTCVVRFNTQRDDEFKLQCAHSAQCRGANRGATDVSLGGALSGVYHLETGRQGSFGACATIRGESCQIYYQIASPQVLDGAVLAVIMGHTIVTQKRSFPIASVRDGRLRSVNENAEMVKISLLMFNQSRIVFSSLFDAGLQESQKLQNLIEMVALKFKPESNWCPELTWILEILLRVTITIQRSLEVIMACER